MTHLHTLATILAPQLRTAARRGDRLARRYRWLLVGVLLASLILWAWASTFALLARW